MKAILEAIVFDLDGTLVNTIPDVRLALNKSLEPLSSKSIDPDGIYELIGFGANSMIEKTYLMLGIEPAPAQIEKTKGAYLSYYQAHPVVNTHIYPHVVDVLKQLQKANITLAICTNKPAVMTRLVLDALHLTSFFDVISSGDEVPFSKPHGDHLRGVLQQMNVSTKNTVMIGDSEVDRAAAENAGVTFIGVQYGYSGVRFKSQHMIANFHDLPFKLESLFLLNAGTLLV